MCKLITLLSRIKVHVLQIKFCITSKDFNFERYRLYRAVCIGPPTNRYTDRPLPSIGAVFRYRPKSVVIKGEERRGRRKGGINRRKKEEEEEKGEPRDRCRSPYSSIGDFSSA